MVLVGVSWIFHFIYFNIIDHDHSYLIYLILNRDLHFENDIISNDVNDVINM